MTDPIVESVCKKLRDRSAVGINKYGMTLADNPDDVFGWLKHLQEEQMDSCNYIERLMVELKK